MNEEKIIRVHPDELETINEAINAEFESPSRITTGAYLQILARERLAALEAGTV